MKKNTIKIVLLALVTSQLTLAAPLPIEFGTVGGVTYVKRLNNSAEFPIELFKSTTSNVNNNTRNRYFGARTMARLGTDGLSTEDQKRVRNEVCASDRIYSQHTALGADEGKLLPGSMGVYLNDDAVISVSDTGIAGERLDSVLRKLSNADSEFKVAAAKYYAVAMTKTLELIHDANVLWNNIELRNFYVRPDGGLYGVDFSEAKLSAAQAEKDKEFDDFTTNTVQSMYRLLFPQGDEAYKKYNDLLKWGELKEALRPILSGVVGPNTAGGEFSQDAVQGQIPGLTAVAAAANGVGVMPKEEALEAAVAAIYAALPGNPVDLPVVATLPKLTKSEAIQAALLRIAAVAGKAVGAILAVNDIDAASINVAIPGLTGAAGGATIGAGMVAEVPARGIAKEEGVVLIANAMLAAANDADHQIFQNLVDNIHAVRTAIAPLTSATALAGNIGGNEFTQAGVTRQIPGLTPATAQSAANGQPRGASLNDSKLRALNQAAYVIYDVARANPADLNIITKLTKKVPAVKTKYTQVKFIAELNRVLPLPHDGGPKPSILEGGLTGDYVNAVAYLQESSHFPYRTAPFSPIIARGNQQAADVPNAIVANAIYFDKDNLTPLIPVLGVAAGAYTPAFCFGWDGK